MFVGWDWASAAHDVTVIDDAGTVVDHWAPPHTEAGLGESVVRLARWGRPEELPVAIEQSGGLVVDRLLAAGHPVVPIHAARPRWGAAGAKSDPGDSYKLAEDLRTDRHRLRRLQPLDDATRELQALVRLREDHIKAKVAASNQLGALLEAHWPGAKQAFSRLASEIALAFLEAYPTPQAAARLGEARLAAFCRRHSYRGGRSPAELLTGSGRSPPRRSVWPRRCSPNWSAPGPAAAHPACHHRRPRPRPWRRPARPRQGQAACPHAPHRRGQPRPARRRGRPHPGACRHRRAGHRRVRRRAGHPSLRQDQDGGVPLGRQRRARAALHAFADNSRHAAPWAAKPYADARRRGKHHPHAIRILARAWLRVMWACWHTNTAYDPARHRAEQRLAA
jgi:Transposase